MSLIGGPIAAGVAGAPEANRNASKAKEKPRNDEARQRRRFEDALELHVSEVESADAVHTVKEHASEDADSERQAKQHPQFMPRAPTNSPAGPMNNPYHTNQVRVSDVVEKTDDPTDSANVSTDSKPPTPPKKSIDVTG